MMTYVVIIKLTLTVRVVFLRQNVKNCNDYFSCFITLFNTTWSPFGLTYTFSLHRALQQQPSQCKTNNMNLHQNDPLLQITKCEMCPKNVTNFVFGLCERCVTIWANKRSMETLHITIDHVKAAIVSMSQNKINHQTMHGAFRCVIEEEQRRRKHKVEVFQKLREKFQDGVIIHANEEYCAATNLRYEVEENFYDVPLPSTELGQVLEDWQANSTGKRN